MLCAIKTEVPLDNDDPAFQNFLLQQYGESIEKLSQQDKLQRACDAPVERSKRPRDDSDPWSVAWPSDTHRRLEVLGDNKVVINWMNGAWEVKGEEHAILVRG